MVDTVPIAATSPLKNGLVAAHRRAADFAGLKNPVESRGWMKLVLSNRRLKKPGRFFQHSVTEHGAAILSSVLNSERGIRCDPAVVSRRRKAKMEDRVLRKGVSL